MYYTRETTTTINFCAIFLYHFRICLFLPTLFFLPINLLLAQSEFNVEGKQALIDSLKRQTVTANNKEKAQLYNDISSAYIFISYDSVHKYINLTLEASKKSGDLKIQAIATKNLGLFYSGKNQYIKAIETLKQAVGLSKKVNDYDLQVICLNNIGYISNAAFQLDVGLKYLFDGLKICEEQPLKKESTRGLILGNIAACYTSMDDHKMALKYLRRVIDFANTINDDVLKIRHCDEIALSLSENNLDEEAMTTCQECIRTCKESGYITPYVNALTAMSKILFKKGSFDKALEFARQGEKEGSNLGMRSITYESFLLQTKILAKQNNVTEAIQRAKEAYKTFKKLRPRQAAEITDLLSELYTIKKDFENALKFRSLHLKWTKADQEQKAKYQAAELEAKYQNETQLKQIEFLHKEKVLTEKASDLYKIGMGLLSGALLIGILLFLDKRRTANQLTDLNRELKHTQKELRTQHDDLEKYIESNIQLEQFAHVASHDLRSPIVTIKSFSDLLKDKAQAKLNDDEQLYLQYIQTNAEQTLELVTDLLEYSKINSQKINLQTIDLGTLVTNVKDMFQHHANEKMVSINIQGVFPKIIADEVKLKRVFQNLISNAIKFSDTKRKNQITLSCIDDKEVWKLEVSDTGIGMKDHKIDIFKPYKQLHRKQLYKGSGMGLAISQRIIEQHGGHIGYDTQYGVGSTFYFSIPKPKG